MFALVQYTNGERDTVIFKRVKIIQGRSCIVKVGGTAYEALLLRLSDSKDELNVLKNKPFVTDDIEFHENTGHGKIEDRKFTFKDKLPNPDITDEKILCSALNDPHNKDHLDPEDATNTVVHEARPLEAPDSKDELDVLKNKPIVTDDIELFKNTGYGKMEDLQSVFNDKLPDPDITDKKILCSTLNDSQNSADVHLDISHITGAEYLETPESSAPSGASQLLKELGDDWLKSSDESNIASQLSLSSYQHSHDFNCDPSKPLSLASVVNASENVNDNIPATEICSTKSQQTSTNHHSHDLSQSSGKVVNTSNMSLNNGSSAHNSSKDSNYNPLESTNKETESSVNSSKNSALSEKSLLADNSLAPDVRELDVPVSKIFLKRTMKKHFCLFCHQLQCKISRHLMSKHKDQEEIQELLNLPVKHNRRREIIDKLRKQGDFLHNTKSEFNTGILISSRQRQEKFQNTAEDYICCKNCKAFFSKKSIRFHYYKCDTTHKKRSHTIAVGGRRITGYIHNKADPVLRRVIFPVLNDDEVSRSIRYDELVILYGNKLCQKYTLDHQHDMIRAQLRLLGRFKLAIKSINSGITDFSSIFQPQHFDSSIEALRAVANWKTDLMSFQTPAVAQNLSTLIKKMANKYRTECIKNQDEVNKKSVYDFLLLWEEEVPVLINKKALEDQTLQKRQKKIILPSKNDIKLLFDYLKNQAVIVFDILQENFDLGAWKLLNSCTLILMQIFNRRRAGEIERLKLIDFENRQELDENINQDLCTNLSKQTIEYAKQYVRLTLRGKLSRTVSVLLSPYIVQFINTLCKYRKQAGVKSSNEYVFAVTGKNVLKKQYIRACPLMRRFANECGALIPSSLRGTTLRKHIATFTAMLDVEENQLDRLANFMGHHKEIHKNIYRVPVPVAEMTDISRLLVAAMGGDEEEENVASESERSDSSDEEDLDSNNALTKNNNSNDISTELSTMNQPSTSQNKTRAKKRLRQNYKNTSKKTRSRSTSPYEKTKRTKWSNSEKKAVNSFFGDILKLKKLPSLVQCQYAISEYDVLRKRRPEQLKSFIDNQRKQKSRRKS